MRMTGDAQAWLDEQVRRMLAEHPAAEGVRPGLRYELMGHLHAAGEREALARGRDEVTRADLEDALEKMGGPAALARAFLPPASASPRAGLGIRLGAYAIDAVLVYVGLMTLWTALYYLLVPLFNLLGLDMGAFSPDPTQLFDWDDLPKRPAGSVLVNVLGLLLAIVGLGASLAYFTWFESRGGRTLGKRVLGLRALRQDGTALDVRDALLRNLVKAVPPLLPLAALDALFIPYEGRLLRASDRILDTMVVREGVAAPHPPRSADATP